MANPKVIQIPVELQTSLKNQASNLQKLYKEYQGMFDRVDPGSAFAKSIVKSFSKIEGKFNLADGLLGKEFFSQADLNKVVTAMGTISDIMSEIQARAQGASLTTLGLDTTKVDEARQRLTDLQKQIRSLKNEKVGSILGANSKDLQDFASLSKTTGFSGGKSYTENYRSMAAAVGNLNQEYGRLAIEADNAKKALDAANSAVAQAKVDFNMAQGALEGRRLLNEDIANKFMAVKVSGKGATRESIIQQYQDLLDEQLFDGTWIEGGENFAQIVAGWLNISEGELSGTAEQIVANLKSAINTAMKGGPLASNVLRTNAKSVLNQEQEALRRDAGYTKAEEQVQLAAANVAATGNAAEEAVNTLTAATNTVDQTKLLLDQVISQMERLKTLQDAYNKSVDKTYESQVNEARQGVTNARRDAYEPFGKELEQHTKNAQQAAHEAQISQNEFEDNNRAIEQQNKAAERRAQEAENFKENLKQSVRHWMSAQQIINIVKDGIRQAVQDIKGLDSAMSNIAVVTDMSISDLWGKINDYMAIAQQYGVTTQGVYEVSQLYYQQGLATAEVMELTTETLKLARVANMDYKDSADAMTVALRGFKMEMSEAATVTDVYSKVAAVTASDQAELAIAMSKTASSAASVGSSFENTTAMLAVMVETTRESAQNLGSALKSIISRYGEMKSGLTQDSEGEIIDYNKVDTALRSVGISIKDAQGQFRNFDDVIFELSEAWGGLDKNTQRYIATIMAGNRQQSRFIALVDNYERLKEVQAAADNSEDAGLLQYAKTLDSLETKMNNIKTSFQQFYMSIFNGEDFKNILDIINNVIKSLNRVGPLLGSLNILNLINQIKMVGQLLINSFSNGLSKVQKSRQEWQDAFTGGWESAGDKIGQKIASGINKYIDPTIQQIKTKIDGLAAEPTKAAQAISLGANTNRGSQSMAYVSAMQHYNNIATGIENNPNASAADQKFAEEIRRAGQIFHDQTKEGAQEFALKIIDAAEKARNKAIQSAEEEGQQEKKDAVEEGRIEKQNAQKNTPSTWQNFTDKMLKNKTAQNVGKWAYGIGTVAQTAGMMINQDTMGGYDASTIVQGVGGAATAVGQFITGNFVGAAISAFTTIATTWTRIAEREKVKLENLEKASEKANIERAEKNNRAQELSEALSNLKKLQAARNESQEAEQAFVEASNTAAEKFPELISYYDKTGNAIIDTVENATEQEWLLIDARRQAAKATADAAAAELAGAIEARKQKESEVQENQATLQTEMTSTAWYGWRGRTYADSLLTKVLDTINPELGGVNNWTFANDKKGTHKIYEEYGLQQLSQLSNNEDSLTFLTELEDWIFANVESEETQQAIFENLTSTLQSLGVIKKNQTYIDWKADLQRLNSELETARIRENAGRQAVLTSEITTWLASNDPRIGKNEGYEWRTLDGFEDYFYDMAISGTKFTEEDFTDDGSLKADGENNAKAVYQTRLSKLSAAFSEWFANGISETQQQIFDDIMSNPTQYSAQEIQSELTKLGLGEGLLHDEVMDYWTSETIGEYERLMKAFELTTPQRKEGESDKDYKARLTRALRFQSQSDLTAQLIANDLQAAQQYLEFQQECQDIIDGKGAGSEAARNRMDTVLTILNEIADGQDEGAIFGIDESAFDPDALSELKTLLTASNAGTYEWGYQIAELVKQATGKDVFGLIESMLYENINTRLETIFASIDETVKGIEDLTQKQEQGFSFSDARAFASKLGQDFTDIFKTTEDGKLVLINYEQSLLDYYNYELQNLNNLNNTINDAYTEVASRTLPDAKMVYSLPAIQGSKELQNELDKFFLENANATKEDVLLFLKGLGAGLNDASAIVQAQANKAISNAAFSDFIKSTENAYDNLQISYDSFKENFALFAPDEEIPKTLDEWSKWFEGFHFFDFGTGQITNYDAAKEFSSDKEYQDWLTTIWQEQLTNSFDALRMGTKINTDVDKRAAEQTLSNLGFSQDLINELLSDSIINSAEALTVVLSQNVGKNETLIETAERIGADFNEIIEGMVGLPGQIVTALGGSSALTPEMRDAINEVRNTLYDSITGLLGGTGTWDQATKLQAAVGTDVNLEFIETSQGIRLLTNSIGNLMEALSSDNSALYAQAFTEISQNIQTYYPHLENVYDIIEETGELQAEIKKATEKGDEKRVKSLEQQKRLLETAARYQSNMAGSAGFNFMSSNLPGNAENYLTYIENIGSAQEALQGLASSGTIDAASLMRMLQFAEAENGALPGGANWTDIYAAVSTASPDGTISAESLYELFGASSQADLAQKIADAMRDADIEFREKQAKIQDEITSEKQWLSSATGIEQNWEKIIGGEAPLTVRMDGEPIKEMTEPMAKELAAKWAALSEGERKQILDTGVWEISTIDQTVQDAAKTLVDIYGIVETIAAQLGVKVITAGEQVNTTTKQAELARVKLETLQRYGASETDIAQAQAEYNKALEAQTVAINEYRTAKEDFEAVMAEAYTLNLTFNSEKVKQLIESILKGPFTLPIKFEPFSNTGETGTGPVGGGGGGGGGGKFALHFLRDNAGAYGNVNGLALAEGNTTSKLIAGASMANKTLVGELGPELAVYNGHYHLLGQNGAEFVNLPSDAIIFNHKQTEGIAKGQMGVRGRAMSDGNLAELWKLYANNRNATGGWDITSGSGGGGKSYNFAEQEGEEWYNYLRRIAKLEQEINQLEAERENIMDGGAYLRNLRETQTIYQEQLITQKQLLEYQKAQLELERKQIEEKWGNVLTFTDEGLLQYAVGNETNGGKGVLNILELFNSMSGAEQVAKVKELGYSYTDQNGKALEGEELVQKFLEELTGDYEHYDDLYDSVAESTAELEEFKKAIKDAEDEIRDNRIELEEKIYGLVVEGWENNIEKMEEELDILSEANERYINGLSEALEKEKSLYDKNEATADREQLQRRLSLLRRSGGSASEIASLEEQLNDTLKDEYFQHQQEAIDKVAEASQTQIEKMEEQIQIQKDQLEFSKEHGLIWEDVNRILSGSTSEILEFIQGNDSTFIEKSATEIGKQLEEWSKKVGIFTEDRQTQEYTKEATKNFNADTLNSSVFNKASAEEKKTYTDMFASYFTNARMEGQDADAAYAYAYDELRNYLENDIDGQDTGGNKTGTGGTGNGSGGDTGGTSGRVKYDFQGKTYTASSKEEAWTAINLKAKALEEQLIESALRNVVHGGDAEELKKAAQGTATNIRQKAKSSIRPYFKGGLVDYTGLAMVHGSKSRPESFLNAEQTAQITEALHSNGKNSVLSDVRQAVTEIAAAAKALVMNETNNSSSINVAPGAVVVKVEKLNDKYDIDSVADDIMNKMVSIASKATSRGVNRR